MPLHRHFPTSPHAILEPDSHWVPGQTDSRMAKLPPLVQKLREQVKAVDIFGNDTMKIMEVGA